MVQYIVYLQISEMPSNSPPSIHPPHCKPERDNGLPPRHNVAHLPISGTRSPT